MCGRYTLATQLDLLTDRFAVEQVSAEYSPRYNIAPTQELPVIIQEDRRTLTAMRWGLVPFWAKDESIGNRMINARAETVAEKPSYRKSLERRRCIVPADGFYEWKKGPDGKTKIPMRFVLGDSELFGFAGLWDSWKRPEGGELRTYTIITTDASEDVRSVHDRMPVILHREDEETWLNPDISEAQQLLPLLRPYRGKGLRAYAVSKAVNSPSNDTPSCIVPVES